MRHVGKCFIATSLAGLSSWRQDAVSPCSMHSAHVLSASRLQAFMLSELLCLRQWLRGLRAAQPQLGLLYSGIGRTSTLPLAKSELLKHCSCMVAKLQEEPDSGKRPPQASGWEAVFLPSNLSQHTSFYREGL